MGRKNNFRQSSFWHEQQAERIKEELGVITIMESEF
jgi:hypothetical protein